MAKKPTPMPRLVRNIIRNRIPFAGVTDDDVDLLDQGTPVWGAVCDDTLNAEGQSHAAGLLKTKLAIATAIDADVNRRRLADRIKFAGLSTAIAVLREAGAIDLLRRNLSLGTDIYLHALGTAVAQAAIMIASIPLKDADDVVVEHDVDTGDVKLRYPKKSKLLELLNKARERARQLTTKLDYGDAATAARMMSDMFQRQGNSEDAGGEKGPGGRVKSNAADIMRRFAKKPFLAQVLEAIGSGLRAGERVGEYVALDGIKPVGTDSGDNILKASAYHLSGFLDDGDRFLLEVANMANHSLEQVKTINQKKSSGHVICLVDTSGSMSGDPIVYAKAAMGALALKAMEEEKLFSCILFSDASSVRRIDITNQATFMDAVEYFHGGGTDFQAPLSSAVEIVKERKRSIGTGVDLIMITDGQAGLDPDFIRRFMDLKAEHDIELTGFFIGGNGDCLGPLLDRGGQFEPGTDSIVDVMNAMRK